MHSHANIPFFRTSGYIVENRHFPYIYHNTKFGLLVPFCLRSVFWRKRQMTLPDVNFRFGEKCWQLRTMASLSVDEINSNTCMMVHNCL